MVHTQINLLWKEPTFFNHPVENNVLLVFNFSYIYKHPIIKKMYQLHINNLKKKLLFYFVFGTVSSERPVSV